MVTFRQGMAMKNLIDYTIIFSSLLAAIALKALMTDVWNIKIIRRLNIRIYLSASIVLVLIIDLSK
jgi:hypothetical protein